MQKLYPYYEDTGGDVTSTNDATTADPRDSGGPPDSSLPALIGDLQTAIASTTARGLPIGPSPVIGRPAGVGGISETALQAARNLNRQTAQVRAGQVFAAMRRTAAARAAEVMAGVKRMSRDDTVAVLLDAVEEARQFARLYLGGIVEEELRGAHLLGAEMINEAGPGAFSGRFGFLSPFSPENVLGTVRASLAKSRDERVKADRPAWEGPNGGVLLGPELASQVTDAIVATALRGPQSLYLDAARADLDESASRDAWLTGYFNALSLAFSPVSRSVIHTGIGDLATWEMWRSSAKMIYDVDGTMWETAAQLEDQSLIYTQMLHRLQHPDPVIVFPEPIDLELDDSRDGIAATVIAPDRTDGRRLARMFACFVSGSTANQAEDPEREEMRHVHSTHPKDGSVPAALSLLFFGLACEPNGAPEFSVDPETGRISPNHICYRVNIDITEAPIRFADLADAVSRTFKLLTISDEAKAAMAEAGILDTETSSGPVRETGQVMDRLVRRTLAFLIYLCCASPDLERVTTPATKTKNKAKKKKAKKARAQQTARRMQLKNLMRAGYQVGAQLRALRRDYDDALRAHDDHTGPGRQPPRPHWRAAHTRRVRYGPGLSLVEPRWFWPTFVLGSKVRGQLGKEAPATIRKVTR